MAGSEPVDVHLTERRGACDFVRRTLVRPACGGLTKAHKGGRASRCGEGHGIDQGADDAADRPVPQDRTHRGRRRGATRPFERRYRAADIALLAEVDEVDETLGGLVRTGHPAGDVAPIRGLWQ